MKYPKWMLSRPKMDATIKRYTATSDLPQFGKQLSLQHPRHSCTEDRMSRLRSQDFSRENGILPNFHFRNDLIYRSQISNHLNYLDLEEEMLLNPQIREKFKKRSKSKRSRNSVFIDFADLPFSCANFLRRKGDRLPHLFSPPLVFSASPPSSLLPCLTSPLPCPTLSTSACLSLSLSLVQESRWF